jgi:hypothetical protein
MGVVYDRDVVESAFLAAKARFLTFTAAMDEQWAAGNADAALGILDTQLSSLPSEVQARSKEKHPEEWAELQARMAARNKNGGTNAR